jgi:site-specific DNA-methyltransferase (adenine-specific)
MELAEGIEIYEGDCLDILPLYNVDMVLTDPPYNISQENQHIDRSKMYSPVVRRESPITFDFGEWDNRTPEEFIEFTNQWFDLCAKSLGENGTFISFFRKEDISLLSWRGLEHDIRTRTIFTWCKSNPVPSFRKVNYLSATEFAWIGSRGDWTINFSTQSEMKNYLETANGSSWKKTNHPTEKHLGLIYKFIVTHTNEGDLVLDPFMGSGTTGVACAMAKRRFIGIEQKHKWFEVSKEEILTALTQPTLL